MLNKWKHPPHDLLNNTKFCPMKGSQTVIKFTLLCLEVPREIRIWMSPLIFTSSVSFPTSCICLMPSISVNELDDILRKKKKQIRILGCSEFYFEEDSVLTTFLIVVLSIWCRRCTSPFSSLPLYGGFLS